MSRAGFKQIGMCNAGTLLTTPVNPTVIGLRQEATLDIEPHKTIKDYRDRELPNMHNFKFSGETLQGTMKVLKALVGFVNLNADVQIQTTPQSATAGSEDVFQFTGDNKLAVGFEYSITGEKRSCKIMFEGAMEQDRAISVIDAADSNTFVSLGGTCEGVDFTKYRAPRFLAFEFPDGTSLISMDDIVERKLIIKTKGKKDIYNRDIVDYLTVELSLTGKNAAITDLVTLYNKSLGASVTVQEKNSGSHYDGFEFAANVLTHSPSAKFADNDRLRTVKFTGDVPIYDVSFDLEAAAGGEASGDGTVGGTMKFGCN